MAATICMEVHDAYVHCGLACVESAVLCGLISVGTLLCRGCGGELVMHAH